MSFEQPYNNAYQREEMGLNDPKQYFPSQVLHSWDPLLIVTLEGFSWAQTWLPSKVFMIAEEQRRDLDILA